MYRGILKLENDTSILRKNGSFANNACVLFVKTKFYLCRCNFAKKQINKNS